MSKASGSIDLKSLKVAGEGASKYITTIESDNGIQVHATNNPNLNYIKINASGMEVFKTNGASSNPSAVSVAEFGETIRVGKEDLAHIIITSGGLDVYNNTDLIGHWGYDSSSETIPYFTFGSRATTSSSGLNAIKGSYSTVLGYQCVAGGTYSYAQGYYCESTGSAAHAEGNQNRVYANFAHVEGSNNLIDGNSLYSHAEGYHNTITGNNQLGTDRSGRYVHIGGLYNTANHDGVFMHGQYLQSTCANQILIGKYNHLTDLNATNGLFIIGGGADDNNRSNKLVIDINGDLQIQDGFKIINETGNYLQLTINGINIIKKINNTDVVLASFLANDITIGEKGYSTISNSYNPYVTINSNGFKVSRDRAGNQTDIYIDVGMVSPDSLNIYPYFSFGNRNMTPPQTGVNAIGRYSIAEGEYVSASGPWSHGEGYHSDARGRASHAEGYETDTINGDYSHSEGLRTSSRGIATHTQNGFTIANSDYQTAIGKCNIIDNSNNYALIIGNGTPPGSLETGTVISRSNAFTVDWNGNVELDLAGYQTTDNIDKVIYDSLNSLGWISGTNAVTY